MLIRIVRMDFKEEKVDNFVTFFETVKARIADFPGCNHVELCKDSKLDHVFYTFSKWDSEADLEKYRRSDLFEEVWSQTKKMFGGKPRAYSLVTA
ncbi:MAG: antibiotic biosynthesis monooxygenase family protein [Bacteroidota bacterium]